jgi:hypothetical protein
VLDAPRMSAAEVARLQKREKELQATVAKLVVSEEATETSFTCFSCVQVFTKPVTCIPCGHSYCESSERQRLRYRFLRVFLFRSRCLSCSCFSFL